MSLFGEADDGDRRRVQRENLIVLTKLIDLGAKRKLPPLNWRLPEGYGTLCGEVSTFTDAGGNNPREVFDAWSKAIATLPRIQPGKLGFRRDGTSRDERTRDDQTRMIEAFVLPLAAGSWPAREFVIQAAWYEDDLEKAV